MYSIRRGRLCQWGEGGEGKWSVFSGAEGTDRRPLSCLAFQCSLTTDHPLPPYVVLPVLNV